MMNPDTAERWVVISALIVAGVYAYRRLTETVAAPPIGLDNLTGKGPPPPLGVFATAWGVTFLGVSIMASASAQLGGAFALLIATSDLLVNMPALAVDITKHGTVKGHVPNATAALGSPPPASNVTGTGVYDVAQPVTIGIDTIDRSFAVNVLGGRL